MVVKSGLLISFKGNWSTGYQLPSAHFTCRYYRPEKGKWAKSKETSNRPGRPHAVIEQVWETGWRSQCCTVCVYSHAIVEPALTRAHLTMLCCQVPESFLWPLTSSPSLLHKHQQSPNSNHLCELPWYIQFGRKEMAVSFQNNLFFFQSICRRLW